MLSSASDLPGMASAVPSAGTPEEHTVHHLGIGFDVVTSSSVAAEPCRHGLLHLRGDDDLLHGARWLVSSRRFLFFCNYLCHQLPMGRKLRKLPLKEKSHCFRTTLHWLRELMRRLMAPKVECREGQDVQRSWGPSAHKWLADSLWCSRPSLVPPLFPVT